VTEVLAPAKVNLALVVGPLRPDGRHEVVTVLQRVTLADAVAVDVAPRLEVSGFAEDTLVREALEALARRAGTVPRWRVHLRKEIPVAAGLGGGSSDAAAAVRLANHLLEQPLDAASLQEVAAELGADVPFFLTSGPQLGQGDGTSLSPLELPQDFWVVLVLPAGEAKESTASVYREFDGKGGAAGFEQRRAELTRALALGDLAALPPNDLASSPIADELKRRGAFRADVTGAGPCVYGLFEEEGEAARARAGLAAVGETWIAAPAW